MTEGHNTELPGSLISNREPSKPAFVGADVFTPSGGAPKEQRARQPLPLTGKFYADRVLRVLLAPPAMPADIQRDYYAGVMARHFDIEQLAAAAGVRVIKVLASLAVLERGEFIRKEFDGHCTGVHVWLTCQVKGE